MGFHVAHLDTSRTTVKWFRWEFMRVRIQKGCNDPVPVFPACHLGAHGAGLRGYRKWGWLVLTSPILVPFLSPPCKAKVQADPWDRPSLRPSGGLSLAVTLIGRTHWK